MSERKLNIVWICYVSNPQIYTNVKFGTWQGKNIARFLLGKPLYQVTDYGQWNTNAILQFEKFEDIKLTVIFPYDGINGNIQRFSIAGVDYICYRPDDDNLLSYVFLTYGQKMKEKYPYGRHIVKKLIEEINPDIVHVIGAENPRYSICALDVPKNIPCVISLQTLMSVPEFKKNYPISEKIYLYRTSVEKAILKRADYIASRIKVYNEFIKEHIKTDAIFLQMPLALGVDINVEPLKKKYDFVYFANDISKAADDAIEAFAIAYQKNPSLTLNISGGYDVKFKSTLEKRMKELCISNNVYITGPKQTHDEVIEQIKKSKFALLPLKVDLISSTIREAMACGLPVVTTITPSTPKLNLERESVLLSKKGDYQSMANNMLRLLEDEEFAKTIQKNAFQTVKERYSNEAFMKMWRKGYYEIIENFHHGTPFSEDVIDKG